MDEAHTPQQIQRAQPEPALRPERHPGLGSARTERWKDVWEARSLQPARGSALAQLMAADGLDTGFGDVAEADWLAYVARTADLLGVTPATSVFEVGCGAGAFLYELYRRGCPVGGVDRSATLVRFARATLPGGRFDVADAVELNPGEPADVVLSSGVFMYFPSLEYAHLVIERMVAKATRAVAVLDVPDAATRAEALAHRIATVGGERAYRERYEGLEHLYYDRDWVTDALRACGVVDVRVADQEIAHYENARFRFNAWGTVPSAAA
jgi:SAM-dependent methyltransferase